LPAAALLKLRLLYASAPFNQLLFLNRQVMEVDLVEALKKKEQALSSAKPPSPAVSYVHGVHAVSGAGVAKWANFIATSFSALKV
jgi:hypothetical protein